MFPKAHKYAFIYPVVTHWGWTTQGWLYQGYDFEINGQMETIRYEDYGGSGLVHLVGGTSAFFATCFLGPRLGRFHTESGTVINIRGHSVAMATMGIFVLLFGFMAFNAASQLHITQSGDATVISLAVFNTLISASVGGVSSLITHRIGLFGHTWNILAVINGAFVGMVSICGGCNAMRPWGAALVGFIAAFIMKALEKLLIRFEIDDPLNAVGRDATVISLAVFNTLISASVGGVSSLITHSDLQVGFRKVVFFILFCDLKSEIMICLNDWEFKLVSICGGCNAMRPWGAALVGFIAAFIMKALEKLLIRFEIDDPLNAVGTFDLYALIGYEQKGQSCPSPIGYNASNKDVPIFKVTAKDNYDSLNVVGDEGYVNEITQDPEHYYAVLESPGTISNTMITMPTCYTLVQVCTFPELNDHQAGVKGGAGEFISIGVLYAIFSLYYSNKAEDKLRSKMFT
ncbi:ammonium transporter Amt1 [Bulinus truncatus]|nr:ammonium transporter Amt1 [Bulinus truncatus]